MNNFNFFISPTFCEPFTIKLLSWLALTHQVEVSLCEKACHNLFPYKHQTLLGLWSCVPSCLRNTFAKSNWNNLSLTTRAQSSIQYTCIVDCIWYEIQNHKIHRNIAEKNYEIKNWEIFWLTFPRHLRVVTDSFWIFIPQRGGVPFSL